MKKELFHGHLIKENFSSISFSHKIKFGPLLSEYDNSDDILALLVFANQCHVYLKIISKTLFIIRTTPYLEDHEIIARPRFKVNLYLNDIEFNDNEIQKEIGKEISKIKIILSDNKKKENKSILVLDVTRPFNKSEHKILLTVGGKLSLNLVNPNRGKIINAENTASLTIELNDSLIKPFWIGQNPNCDLQLKNSTVSEWHCKIKYFAGLFSSNFWIMDYSSTNGTALNGARLMPKKWAKLNSYSLIRVPYIQMEQAMQPGFEYTDIRFDFT